MFEFEEPKKIILKREIVMMIVAMILCVGLIVFSVAHVFALEPLNSTEVMTWMSHNINRIR